MKRVILTLVIGFMFSSVILAVFFFSETLYGLPALNLIACIVLGLIQLLLSQLTSRYSSKLNFVVYLCVALGGLLCLGFDWRLVIFGVVYGVSYFISELMVRKFMQ
ncbi:hypothetical protein PASE110613_12575 [Paenibacillus sediminis]|uniref:Apolipoprotein N-acyltransferase n=1 Tax=Paenibacillus sediminis TaxID=664909 RepID=A0ABS4H530_9BACL|nr:apolipoprotein N-acyltransferase [Paenibacillus sediminis]